MRGPDVFKVVYRKMGAGNVSRLGQIKKVPVRDLWKHEEQELAWLAKEENIGRLSEVIGLELQVEGIEVPVGPFTADILAKEASGNYVVIENQYGKTDHDHLGKLLTYAATLGAIAVVWVAEKFTDEHRKAVEWLNEHTTEELSLYAVELELWQIDQYEPSIALQCTKRTERIFARRASAVKSAGPITDTQKLQLTRILGDFSRKVIDEESRAVGTYASPRCVPMLR